MAKVEMEVASEVECVVCGAKKFSMYAPYVCYRCWKNGNAAKLIVLWRAGGTTPRVPDVCPSCAGEKQVIGEDGTVWVCGICGGTGKRG